MDHVYDVLGGLIGTWLGYNILQIILFYLIDKKLIPFVAFIGSFILILVLTSYTIGFVKGFIFYIPILFVWFVIDLIKLKKKEKPTNQSI
jgi:hypothetical protein